VAKTASKPLDLPDTAEITLGRASTADIHRDANVSRETAVAELLRLKPLAKHHDTVTL
jgi:hypothetical protein